MIRAIIFDCFGVVLTDSLQLIRHEVLAKDPAAAEEIAHIITANNKGLIEPQESNKRIADLLGISPAEFKARVAAGEVKDVALLAFILTLRKTYKTAMLSNIAGSSLRRRFAERELETYFDIVVASGDIGHAKPENRAYEIVAERLGELPEMCLFVDDRPAFCAAAEAVGMQSMVYTDFVRFQYELDRYLK